MDSIGSFFHPFESYYCSKWKGMFTTPGLSLENGQMLTNNSPSVFFVTPMGPNMVFTTFGGGHNMLFASYTRFPKLFSTLVFSIFTLAFSLLCREILPMEFCPHSDFLSAACHPLTLWLQEEDLVQWTRKTYKITVEVSPLVSPIGCCLTAVNSSW